MRKFLLKIALFIAVVGGGGWALSDPDAFFDTASVILTWSIETAIAIFKNVIGWLADRLPEKGAST